MTRSEFTPAEAYERVRDTLESALRDDTGDKYNDYDTLYSAIEQALGLLPAFKPEPVAVEVQSDQSMGVSGDGGDTRRGPFDSATPTQQPVELPPPLFVGRDGVPRPMREASHLKYLEEHHHVSEPLIGTVGLYLKTGDYEAAKARMAHYKSLMPVHTLTNKTEI